MNEFTLVGTIEELMPMMETSNGISVINFVVRTEKGYISKKENLLKISAFKETLFSATDRRKDILSDADIVAYTK